MNTIIEKHFRRQGESCARMGSPFTGRLLQVAAARFPISGPLGERLSGWEGTRVPLDAVALRFAGGLHALVLSGQDDELAGIYPPNEAPADDDAFWTVIDGTLTRHQDFMLDFMDYAPQTNETGRAACLMLGFQQAAKDTGKPLFMLEMGASAGLNQGWDRFRYQLGDAVWGPEDSPVQLQPEWRGATPDLLPELEKSGSYACDLNPLDITDPDQALRLRSYIWPDQPVRMQRLDGAISIGQADGLSIARADAADWIAASLALRPGERTTVVYHSIFWQYMPIETQRAVRSAIEVAGDLADDRNPLCWVRMEPYEEDISKAALYYTHWPDPERKVLAFCDYHGWWIEPC